mgnify:CR=1 FL=1
MCAPLIVCAQLLFIIDRVEGEFTIVEWQDGGELTDISSQVFPSPPHEGDLWSMNVFRCENNSTTTHGQSQTSNLANPDPSLRSTCIPDSKRHTIALFKRVERTSKILNKPE